MDLTSRLRQTVQPLTGAAEDYDALMDMIGDARFVLLGEASHGTHEFYHARARITQRLIMEKGFSAVAVEADWPDAYRINRYVRGLGDDAAVIDALAGFKRFPAWMWRNADVLDFIGWLRAYNDDLAPEAPRVGYYGLDLYSLYASTEAVIAYLEKVDPAGAEAARRRYGCFERYGEDTQSYGYAAGSGFGGSCEDEVVKQLIELQRHAGQYTQGDGRVAEDEFFSAAQNARLVKSAEEYYRSMFRGRASSWNLRDRHMADTLDDLVRHLDRQQQPSSGRNSGEHNPDGRSKVVVWAHNSHLGDARATEMGRNGELNVGQLVRERYDGDAVLIGFTTYSGTVTAASDWDKPCERKRVRPALPSSYEALFHDTGIPRFLLNLRAAGEVASALREPRLERAIGVIYHPDTERWSHYFHAWLADQFDAVLHFDETRAVEPLERTARWGGGEVPETFPSEL